MNFLAHSFLSGTNEELLVGNFIADSVKGRQKELFTPGIIKGIDLHRGIDTYTDSHPIVRQTKERLRPGYGKFAGVIADMFYDHFLAANFTDYSTVPLFDFSQYVYATVTKYHAYLPDRVQYFLPHMIEHNWLHNYRLITGIKSSLTGLSRRTVFASNMATSTDELENNYGQYKNDFENFFPQLQNYVKYELSVLDHKKNNSGSI